jgi:hypothetical protein
MPKFGKEKCYSWHLDKKNWSHLIWIKVKHYFGLRNVWEGFWNQEMKIWSKWCQPANTGRVRYPRRVRLSYPFGQGPRLILYFLSTSSSYASARLALTLAPSWPQPSSSRCWPLPPSLSLVSAPLVLACHHNICKPRDPSFPHCLLGPRPSKKKG